MSSDESAIFLEADSLLGGSESDESGLGELYKFIPPPLPLIQKDKYKDKLCLSENKSNNETSRSLLEEKKKSIKNSNFAQEFNIDSMVSLDFICENSNIVYKRDASSSGNPNKPNKLKLDEISLPKKAENKLKPAKSDSLTFESRFESGNLALAIKKTDEEYDLLMQNDTNTKGHTQ